MQRKAEGGAAAVVAVLVVLVVAAFLLVAFTDWDFGDGDIDTVAVTDNDEPDIINVENPIREREVVREKETVIREPSQENDGSDTNVTVNVQD